MNETRLEDGQLTPETTYYYRVRAVNQTGESSWCQLLAVETTSMPTAPPDTPSDLEAEAVSANRIEVTWTDNSDNEDGFTLMGSMNGTTFETLHTTDFEPHTDVLVKDRRNPTYGHKRCLTGKASNLTLDCLIVEGNPADVDLAIPMLDRQKEIYGRYPLKVCF